MQGTHQSPSHRRRATTTALLLTLTALLVQPVQAEEKKQSLTPLPDLNTVEECQRADLQRYLGRTFRFHLYECWADVDIDKNGRVTSFIPEDEDTCRKVLIEECGWVD